MGLEILSKNEGSWKAGIRSTLVGGEQELGFKERIQKEEEEARETLKGDNGRTFRGNGMQQGPCHCKPGVRSMGREGLFGAVAELCKRRKKVGLLVICSGELEGHCKHTACVRGHGVDRTP